MMPFENKSRRKLDTLIENMNKCIQNRTNAIYLYGWIDEATFECYRRLTFFFLSYAFCSRAKYIQMMLVHIVSKLRQNTHTHTCDQRQHGEKDRKTKTTNIGKEIRKIRCTKKWQTHRTIQIEMLKIKSCLWLLAFWAQTNVRNIVVSERASERECVWCNFSSRTLSLKNMDLWQKSTLRKRCEREEVGHGWLGVCKRQKERNTGMGIFWKWNFPVLKLYVFLISVQGIWDRVETEVAFVHPRAHPHPIIRGLAPSFSSLESSNKQIYLPHSVRIAKTLNNVQSLGSL